ncbi:hypothetical protein Slin15195_G041630 [Septoria linicola]|uniref:Uncharacterized protein n=1 Tax=Septoria linicola TaxID=215465 RepID=A0A9Q9AMI6_9PEZI|nr:hypothetical protein Slin14017_G045140 [Septoria linicola]USW50844.1 hypothetical protein Slin15195_G041630 [Septoria linicola]
MTIEKLNDLIMRHVSDGVPLQRMAEELGTSWRFVHEYYLRLCPDKPRVNLNPSKPLTAPEKRLVLKHYAHGVPLTNVAEELGCSLGSLRYRIRTEHALKHLTRPVRPFTPSEDEKLESCCEQGRSYGQIATILGRLPSSVYKRQQLLCRAQSPKTSTTRRFWTNEETDTALHLHDASHFCAYIATHLKRDDHTVRNNLAKAFRRLGRSLNELFAEQKSGRRLKLVGAVKLNDEK